MQEYTARGVVLHKEPSRETDLRVTVFTDEFGKITAKAKSGRKITSKLSAHLEPGTLAFVRLVEKGGLHFTDALKLAELNLTPHDLYALDRLLPPEEQDPNLWEILSTFAGKQEPWDWSRALALLGWDPDETPCEKCRTRKPTHFLLPTQSLYCDICVAASRLPQDAVLYMDNGAGKRVAAG